MIAGDPYHGVRIAVPASGSDRLILAGDGIGPLAWSPDGTRIVYASHGHMEAGRWIWERTYSLRSIDVDGSDQVELKSGITSGLDSVSWSPDGSRIAYAAGGSIYVVGVDGSDQKRIADGSNAAWSPDGRTIAYLVGCEIRMTTPGGEHDRSLVDLSAVRPDAASCDGAVDLLWSPDGRELAAMVDRDVHRPEGAVQPGRVRRGSRWDPHSTPLGLEPELQHFRNRVAADPVKDLDPGRRRNPLTERGGWSGGEPEEARGSERRELLPRLRVEGRLRRAPIASAERRITFRRRPPAKGRYLVGGRPSWQSVARSAARCDVA